MDSTWIEANVILLGITTAIGIVGLVGGVWTQITRKHRRLEERLEGDTKAWRDHVDADTNNNTSQLLVVNSRLDRVEGRLNDADARYNRLDTALQQLLQGQGELKGKIDLLAQDLHSNR